MISVWELPKKPEPKPRHVGPRAADDFDAIRARMDELRRTEGQPVINVAGPAGNPTQPTGAPTPNASGPNPADPKTWGNKVAITPMLKNECKHSNWEYLGNGRYKCRTCDKEEDFCGDGENRG